VYINSYNINRNARKHILSIGGTNFSTVFIALGAFKNSLVVRTHSRDGGSASTEGFQLTGTGSDTGAAIGTGSDTGAASPIEPEPETETETETVSFSTPGSQEIADGSLMASDVEALLAPMALDDSLLNNNSICDLNIIDLQRWVHVTVILSGRSIDVYMDGKLSRSCITGSYFKVDPMGIKVTLLQNGGFDGSLSKISLLNTSLNPSDIYQNYAAGP
jgi:hypothetical protein